MRLFTSSLVVATVLVGLVLGACSAADTEGAAEDDLSRRADGGARQDAGPGAPDAAPDATVLVTPSPLPVIPNQGGPIIARPELVTVTWAPDPAASDLEAFDRWLITSATWKAMMAEWGVGPGKYSGAARLAGAAPPTLSEDDVASVLQAGFAAGTIPPPNGSRIYMLYPPSSTVVTMSGFAGCDTFQAYHSAFDVPANGAAKATKAIFSVTPRCTATQGLSVVDYLTWGSSHEAMEAASDPFAFQPAWRIDDQSVATPELGENADLCAGHPTKIDGHMITRNWSNVAAKAGQRPCVPAPAGPMFGIFADPGEITVTPGKSVTVKLRAYASGPYPAFSVGVFAGDPLLSAKVSASKASNGDVLTLTVKAAAGYVEQPGANLVYLTSQGADYVTRRHLIVHAR